MTSGVYWLHFADGVDYIGKAKNIEERWKQHFISFQKGTAAKNMVRAYQRYGYPETRVIQECHSDHIDIIEEYMIDKYNPSLNTQKPARSLTDFAYEKMNKVENFLEGSTIDHCNAILKYGEMAQEYLTKTEEQSDKIDSLNKEIKHLNKQRSLEEIVTDSYIRAQAEKKEYLNEIDTILRANEFTINQLKHKVQDREEKIDALMKRNLWQRIWNDPV